MLFVASPLKRSQKLCGHCAVCEAQAVGYIKKKKNAIFTQRIGYENGQLFYLIYLQLFCH